MPAPRKKRVPTSPPAAAQSGPVRILSVDGGGIRGIIPATILAHIEQETGKRISELFHLIAGTSTGGIISLVLSKPDSAGAGPISAKELIRLYEDHGREIFNRSFWHGVSSVAGVADEKYQADGLEKLLKKYLGDAQLKDAKPNLLVTAYEIERRDAYFFKSWSAEAKRRNFLMRDVARATSAAPTYFEPAWIPNVPKTDTFALVDGGVFANNPTMCAYAEARVIYPAATDYFVLSLGTGELTRPIPYATAKNWGLMGWMRPVISVIFDGVADTVDYQMTQLLPDLAGKKRYFRLQTRLDEGNDDMDDASKANLRALKFVAERIISDRKADLNAIIAELKQPRAALP